ncbi:hypothetical protein D3C73_669160 [compost metagenome]
MVYRNGYITAAVLLILEVILVTTPFLILQSVFEFPDILRKPASDVFELFQSRKSVIIPTYYIFMLSGLLLIPLSLAVHHLLKVNAESSMLLSVTTGFGVSAGIAQILGFIRWPFLIPYLADTYLSSTATAATKEAVVVVYETFNRYAGMAVGEHLGWVLLGIWLVGISMLQIKSTLFKKGVGLLGLLSGLGLIVSAFEQLAGALAPTFASLNIAANWLMVAWLLISAGFLLFAKSGTPLKKANGVPIR